GNKTREQTLSLQGKKQREALQQLHFITSKLCNYVSKLICNWTRLSVYKVSFIPTSTNRQGEIFSLAVFYTRSRAQCPIAPLRYLEI
ncbi:MAG: hypothetical protein PHX02_03210, partial [Oscillospiraceae bacterium]|nr:hypothetical protein [Oscillospiraceae bacterium]